MKLEDCKNNAERPPIIVSYCGGTDSTQNLQRYLMRKCPVGVMTATEAIQAANDYAHANGLCETQRSRLLTTIRVFFFEKQPPTMNIETFNALVRCYKSKKQNKKAKMIT